MPILTPAEAQQFVDLAPETSTQDDLEVILERARDLKLSKTLFEMVMAGQFAGIEINGDDELVFKAPRSACKPGAKLGARMSEAIILRDYHEVRELERAREDVGDLNAHWSTSWLRTILAVPGELTLCGLEIPDTFFSARQRDPMCEECLRRGREAIDTES
jgi:hypothetical protein